MAKEKAYTRKTSSESDINIESAPIKIVNQLLFNRSNFIIMGIGVGMIFLGLLLMSGGKMADPNVWDESVIYSFRRITLAPAVILLGLVVNIYAIFYKK